MNKISQEERQRKLLDDFRAQVMSGVTGFASGCFLAMNISTARIVKELHDQAPPDFDFTNAHAVAGATSLISSACIVGLAQQSKARKTFAAVFLATAGYNGYAALQGPVIPDENREPPSSVTQINQVDDSVMHIQKIEDIAAVHGLEMPHMA